MKKDSRPIIEHINDFLEYLDIEKGLSNKSQETYQRFLRKFVNWLKINNLEALAPHELSEEHIRKYRVFLSQSFNKNTREPIKRSTQNYYLIALRNLLNYFTDRDILSLPAEKIKLAKSKSDERMIKFLTVDQIKKLLDAPKTSSLIGLRDRAILEVLFSTGLRVAELANLNREQIKITPETKDLEIVIIGKGNRPRPVYLSKRAVKWLRNYLEIRKDKEKALFINYKGPKSASKRLSPRSIENIVKKYAILAGVPSFTTPHTLRHCLHPSTRIVLSDQIISARDLFFHKASEAQTMEWHDLQLRPQKIQDKSYHITPLLSIWADGYNLICSPHHRLFTIGKNGIEEIKVEEVKIGDYVMGIKKFEIQGKPFVTPQFARLLGYIFGDGTVSRKRQVVLLDDKNKNILKFYQNLVRELFILNPSLEKNKYRESWQLKIYNRELVEFILTIGFEPRANQRRLPKEILSAPLEELTEFIAGFYDAEGNTGRIRFFSSSLDLLKDVQMGLLRLGIDAHINWRQRTVRLPQKRTFTHKFYTLHILHRPDQLQFIKNIKTLKKRFLHIEPGFEGEKLPIGKLLKVIKQDAIRKNININDLGRYFDNLVPVRKTVEKIITQLENSGYRSPLLKTLEKITYANNIKWLRIKEKTRLPFGRYSTYDFGIDRYTGNLITDGIISHNSFATDLLSQGVDLKTIQEFLGHKNISTTQIYAHVTSRKLRETHRKFHSLKE
ncbi:MAG: tyrosine-type recombinase/integrase [Patescibacteria group bacterium]|nr:tyrosine-type recombinase/integrase [Patescibacteria group bacterium]